MRRPTPTTVLAIIALPFPRAILLGTALALAWLAALVIPAIAHAEGPPEPTPTVWPPAYYPPGFPRAPLSGEESSVRTIGGMRLPLPSIPRAPTTPTPPPMPNLPDISVAWISRQPAYPRYCVIYAEGTVPILCPGTENDKHFPDPGETVTFTAHLANRGLQPIGPITYTWTLDRSPVATGTLDTLQPGQWVSPTLTWAWDPARHFIGFSARPPAAQPEITRDNNTLVDATDAYAIDVAVHPFIYDAFRHWPNRTGSYTFEDWLQTQIRQMNERFAQAIYPTSPHGILDRIRVDAIQVAMDTGPAQPGMDGHWQFTPPPDDHHTPEDERIIGSEDYARRMATGVDWGLIHELTHQLGFIDLYRVQIQGILMPLMDDLPFLGGLRWEAPDLMGGGSTAPYYDGTYYSDYTAQALNRNHGLRRGYYGDFLFDVPLTTVLILQDSSGLPLSEASVAIYQPWDGHMPPFPQITGTTDAAGTVLLPNRPVSQTVTTATGHTLRPNPFGQIDVIGRNAILILVIRQGGGEDYAMMRLMDFNQAYWAGITQTYTVTLRTHLPPPGALPPPSLQGQTQRLQATLSWSAVPGAHGYRIYRSEEPYSFYELVSTTPGLTATIPLRRSSRFAVTAVDAIGRESRFSPIYRSFAWVLPAAALYNENRREWTVLDYHSGALVSILLDGRVVGDWQIWQYGMGGGQGLSRNASGQILDIQPRQVALFDADYHLLGRVGETAYDPGPLVRAESGLLLGAPFTVTEPIQKDDDTLFLVHFEGSLAADDGTYPLVAQSITYTTGRHGLGILMDQGSTLVYTGTGHFLQEKGGIEMWIQPLWEGTDPRPRTLFAASGPTYAMTLGVDHGYLYAFITDFISHSLGMATDVSSWRAGEWHHVAAVWEPHRTYLYADGILRDRGDLRHPITGTMEILSIGSGPSTGGAQAIIDEVRISSIPRVGSSHRVRILATDPLSGTITVMDMFGGILRRWQDDHVQQPRGLARLPTGHLAVTDQAQGAVALLAYDNDATLTYQGILAAGFAHPVAIDADPRGWLAVADSQRNTISILDPTGVTWIIHGQPNDGYVGPFLHPWGLATGPGGTLLVMDTDNRRVVQIRQGMYPYHWILPIILQNAPLSPSLSTE